MPTVVLYLFWGALSIQKKNNGKNFCIPAAVFVLFGVPKRFIAHTVLAVWWVLIKSLSTEVFHPRTVIMVFL
jgi:hypothetical protein